MSKIFRTEVASLNELFRRMKEEDIRFDADTQRYSGVWKDKMAPSLLILSVLLDRWIPSILLAEEKIDGYVQQWLADGKQRLTYLDMFRNKNMRLEKNVPGGIVSYFEVEKDENGKCKRDEEGTLIRVLKTFDVSNHTYDEMPKELRSKFDNYRMSLVVYEDCTRKEIAEFLRIYNNSTSMNKEQQALTHIDGFARTIKEIESEGLANNIYSLSSKKNAKVQRMFMEAAMSMFFIDNWKTNAIDTAKFLNEHATEEQFEMVADYNRRLLEIIDTDELEEMFVSKGGPHKDAAIMFTAFHEFAKLGKEDVEFVSFLNAFVEELQYKKNEGINYKDLTDIAFTDIDVSYCSDKKADYNTSGSSKASGNVKIRREVILNLLHEYFKEDVVEETEDEKFEEITEPEVVEDIVEENNLSLMSIENSETIMQAGLVSDVEEIMEGCVELCNMMADDATEEDIVKYFEKLDDITVDVDMKSTDFFTIWNIIASIGIIATNNNITEWLKDYVKSYTYREEDYVTAYDNMCSSISMKKAA